MTLNEIQTENDVRIYDAEIAENSLDWDERFHAIIHRFRDALLRRINERDAGIHIANDNRKLHYMTPQEAMERTVRRIQ